MKKYLLYRKGETVRRLEESMSKWWMENHHLNDGSDLWKVMNDTDNTDETMWIENEYGSQLSVYTDTMEIVED